MLVVACASKRAPSKLEDYGEVPAFTVRDQIHVTAIPPTQLETAPEVGQKEGSVPVWLLSETAGNFVA